MKFNFPLLLLAGALTLPAISQAVVTINFAGGIFDDSNGNALADNSLVILVASGVDGNFSAPSVSSLVTGDDVLLGKFATNSSDFSTPGGFIASIAPALSASLTTGQKIEVEWFPGSTTASTAPVGSSYGEYSFTSANLQSTAADWTIPTDGTVISPVFATTNGVGGSLPSSDGFANLTVTGAVNSVPEPSTYALFGGIAALGLAAFRRSRSLA